MQVVTQNATSRFAEELCNCLTNNACRRCIVLKLSQIPNKPKHWSLSVVSIIEECLRSEGTIYFMENGDVIILDRATTRKVFARLVHLLSDRLGTLDLEKHAFQYELPVDAEAVAALLGPNNSPSGDIVTAKITNISAARDSLTRNLINTIGLRRERRAAPQILIVEDDPFFQRLIAGLFTKTFRLTIAKSSADAIDLYIQAAPDLVLLNIGLPDESGFEVLRKILEVDPNAYVVMLSAQASRKNVLHAIRSGAKAFVGKPFTSHRLLFQISSCPFIQDKRLEMSNRKTYVRHRGGTKKRLESSTPGSSAGIQ